MSVEETYVVVVRKAREGDLVLEVDGKEGAQVCVARNDHSFYSIVIVERVA